MTKQLRLEYSAHLLCRTLDVPPSGYYERRAKGSGSPRLQSEKRLEIEIKAAHIRTRETFGPERLQADLADYCVDVGLYRIKHKCKKHGFAASTKIQGTHKLKLYATSSKIH